MTPVLLHTNMFKNYLNTYNFELGRLPFAHKM